jgi:hypothetical protein
METLNSTATESQRSKPQLWIIHCVKPGCRHGVMAPTEWQAAHLLGEHLIQAHVSPRWTRGQES